MTRIIKKGHMASLAVIIALAALLLGMFGFGGSAAKADGYVCPPGQTCPYEPGNIAVGFGGPECSGTILSGPLEIGSDNVVGSELISLFIDGVLMDGFPKTLPANTSAKYSYHLSGIGFAVGPHTMRVLNHEYVRWEWVFNQYTPCPTVTPSPTPTVTPVRPTPKPVAQKVRLPKKLKRGKSVKLPRRTNAGFRLKAKSLSHRTCKVTKGNNKLRGIRKGSCRVRVTAHGRASRPGVVGFLKLKKVIKIRVR